MSYIMGQVTVTNGSGIFPLFSVPAGLCNITFWNSSTAASNIVYIGSSTSVTSANGLQCHSIPTTFFTYVGSKAATFYGTAVTSPGTINYIIVNNF